MTDPSTEIGGPGRSFPTTHWSLVLDARDPGSPSRRSSLEELARLYWRPVYAHFRGKWGKPNEEAKDLTQEFFLALLDGDFLGHLSPQRGRFRAYVRAALDNFARLRHRFEGRLKRGGGALPLSLDAEPGFEPPPDVAPDEVFDREWALSILRDALAEMEGEYRATGREKAFEIFHLHDIEPPPEGDLSYETLAQRFGVSVNDVTHILYRSRQKLRDLAFRRVRETVGDPGDAEAEMNELFGGLKP